MSGSSGSAADGVFIEALRGWSRATRLATLAGLIAMVAALGLMVSPVAQDPTYHDFADQRPLLGIPNFGDVVSNLPFLLVAIWGWRVLHGVPTTVLSAVDRVPYHVFLAGLLLTTFGSGYYHFDPSTPTLFWDRVGIALIAAGLTAVFVADRVDQRLGVYVILPLLAAFAFWSVVHWRQTELFGAGDLRPYALAQFLPGLIVPLICLMFAGRVTDGRYVLYFVAWYGLAKVFELQDDAIFTLLGETISGHTLKHLAAATGCAMVPLMLLRKTTLLDRA